MDQGGSSPAEPSMSDFSHVTQDLDDDENEARRNKPEQVTVHPLTAFLCHVLALATWWDKQISDDGSGVDDMSDRHGDDDDFDEDDMELGN